MQSEARLLAIHCDWEHWRRYAELFAAGSARPTHRRCSSLVTFVHDNDDDEEEDDASWYGDDSNVDRSTERPPTFGGRQIQCDGDLIGTDNTDGGNHTTGSCDAEDEERGQPCTLAAAPVTSSDMNERELTISWTVLSLLGTGIPNQRQPDFATSGPPVLSPEEEVIVWQKYKNKKVPSLHSAKTAKKLLSFLEDPRVCVNEFRQGSAGTPMHSFIKDGLGERVEMIVALLTSGKGANVNLASGNGDGNTPLHLAAERHDTECVKLLLAFGANPLAMNSDNQTPHDITTSFSLKAMLQRTSSVSSEEVDYPSDQDNHQHSQSRRTVLEMEEGFNKLLNFDQELNANIAMAAMLQKREVADWRRTQDDIRPGLRILFLDGGGIRGLAQIDMLMEIERRTGRKIVDAFDWIVGTSTGGIVALGLVYAKKELSELRNMYFRKKDEIFGGMFRISQNTKAMEELVKKYFKNQRMTSVDHPKVLISAVDLTSRTLPVVFFNNFDDSKSRRHLSQARVWEVARATSAAPSVFTSVNNTYIDGGVKANNPAEFAMTEIRHYYHDRCLDMPHISFVVSVGTGIAPAMKKVQFRGENMLAIGSLIELLKCAISDSEEVAGKFNSQCCHLHIPHFRLNPKLSENIEPTETKTLKLVNMLYETRCYLSEQEGEVLGQIVEAFERLKH